MCSIQASLFRKFFVIVVVGYDVEVVVEEGKEVVYTRLRYQKKNFFTPKFDGSHSGNQSSMSGVRERERKRRNAN